MSHFWEMRCKDTANVFKLANYLSDFLISTGDFLQNVNVGPSSFLLVLAIDDIHADEFDARR